MNARSELLLPPAPLASCLAAGIFRDTSHARLSERDRLNYFPATPLYSVTRVFDGTLHMASGVSDIVSLRVLPSLPAISATPPKDHPTSSWSATDVRAITIAIYPDAWMALGGAPDGANVPHAIQNALANATLPAFWTAFCETLAPEWNALRQDGLGWRGSHRISDWARHVTTKAALSGTGRSLRSIERRLNRLTGQSKQAIDFFAKIEDLHARLAADPDASLADMAAAADFSDQSHMGRSVKRVTGFSPKQLNQMIATEEAFWCYRLLGARF